MGVARVFKGNRIARELGPKAAKSPGDPTGFGTAPPIQGVVMQALMNAEDPQNLPLALTLTLHSGYLQNTIRPRGWVPEH